MLGRAPPLVLLAVCVAVGGAMAAVGGERGAGGEWDPPPTAETELPRSEPLCPGDWDDRRPAQTVEGVELAADPHCRPDPPGMIAAFVKGTNHVNQTLLDEHSLHEEAVTKCCDRDGDGDPDVVNLTLEVVELNGFHLESDDLAASFQIAPGISPAFWTFAPKGTIDHAGEAFLERARQPSPPIRVEQHDRVRIELENTHYFPHTIHLHGVDHAFQDADGEGNDGVPDASEAPLRPGRTRTYDIEPRVSGTMFYHCHVQTDVHVAMGLTGIFRIEEARENNTLQTFNPGGGLVRHPAQAVAENYTSQYDYHYQNIDAELHEIPQQFNDPRRTAREMNREFDTTERDADYFLLNGRSFPYTLRESNILLEPNATALVHMLAGGEDTHSIHTHGHKPTVIAKDGVPLEEPEQRDVFTMTAAQRLDIVINGTDDGLHSYGQGTWFMHDHIERAVTTDGINPGGDISTIVYPDHWNETTHLPEANASWEPFFTPEWYRGEIPVWIGLDMPWIHGDIEREQDEGDGGLFPVPVAPVAGLALAVAALAGQRGGRP